jgi:hypothetical protein
MVLDVLLQRRRHFRLLALVPGVELLQARDVGPHGVAIDLISAAEHDVVAAAGAVRTDAGGVPLTHARPQRLHLRLRRPVLRILHAVAGEECDARPLAAPRHTHHVDRDRIGVESGDGVAGIELGVAPRDTHVPAEPRAAGELAEGARCGIDGGRRVGGEDERQRIRLRLLDPDPDGKSPFGGGSLSQVQ